MDRCARTLVAAPSSHRNDSPSDKIINVYLHIDVKTLIKLGISCLLAVEMGDDLDCRPPAGDSL